MARTLTLRTGLVAFGVELPFAVIAPLSYVRLLEVEQHVPLRLLLGLALGLQLVKNAALILLMVRRLRPLEEWLRVRGSPAEHAAQIARAAGTVHRFPVDFSAIWAGSWSLYFVIFAASLWAIPGITIGLSEWIAAALSALAVFCAAFPLAAAMLSFLLGPTAGELSIAARRRDLRLEQRTISLRNVLLVFSLCLVLAPSAWMVTMGFMTGVDATTLVVFSLSSILWAPICGAFLAAMVAGPVRSIAGVFGEIVRRGEVTGVPRIPIFHADEIGRLAEGANEMIDRLAASSEERKRHLEELERAYAEAKSALKVRDDFLTIAAHELRTPLTSLALHLDGMDRDAGKGLPISREKLDRARRQMRHMRVLIDDLMDVSRIQAGRMEIHPKPTSLDGLARETGLAFASTLSSHRVQLHLPDSPAYVQGDPARLEQVISNLLENAVKYSPDGGDIHVSVRADPDQVTVSVRDQGVGISKEDQRYVFERFFRSASASARHVRGLGLGLFICRDIVERHGGRLWVESEPGQGSTFSFTVPRTGPPTPG